MGMRSGHFPNEGDGACDQQLLQCRISLPQGTLGTLRNISPTCCEILLKPLLLLFLDY